ncbi:MAG: Ldh family oxidoreductase [Methanobrevibacter sp.]|jgi:L-2-hydroxycarboxylate dehydrogenase (NAD+)|nr:Ldh family oxidoreductase [Candidatus Methanovirga basalitermitum]
MRINAENEKKLLLVMLEKIGVSKGNAEIVAEATLDADLKGFTSHGLGRFHNYLKGIELNNINTNGEIIIEKETEAMALINGNNNFGQVVAYKSMKIAIEKAKKIGIAAVGTNNSNHFGVTGFYSDLAIKEGVIGFVIANTEPAIAPLGGKEPIIGTNPIAIGVPGDNYISIDMATSATARGKLLESSRKGEKISEGLALDKEGNPTTDPDKALEGSILPFGGHKGYSLAFMIEILTGPLVGAAYGKQVKGTANCDENCTKGDLFVAIDPEKFVGINEFKKETEKFVTEIRTSEPETIVPGDIETKKIDNFRKNGLNIDKVLYNRLNEICNNLDINLNEFIENRS